MGSGSAFFVAHGGGAFDVSTCSTTKPKRYTVTPLRDLVKIIIPSTLRFCSVLVCACVLSFCIAPPSCGPDTCVPRCGVVVRCVVGLAAPSSKRRVLLFATDHVSPRDEMASGVGKKMPTNTKWAARVGEYIFYTLLPLESLT